MADTALPPGHFLFASDSVTEGHPDKFCDRVADAVLDACLAQDPEARVACEACTKQGMVMVLGELETKASLNYEQIIREAAKSVGYDSDEKGLDWRTMNVVCAADEQTADLVQTLATGKASEDAGAGEPGTSFGYATDETPELMPMSHLLATRLSAQLDKARRDGALTWARPDGATQVTVEYAEAPDGSVAPARIHSVVVSARRATDVPQEQAERELMECVVRPVMPAGLCDQTTVYRLEAPKRLAGAAGLSGRRASADLYGGWGAHGGGALSGRDGAKLERAAAYGARWAARSLVSAKLCRRCLVQLSYGPGDARPALVRVDSYGTAKACGKTDAELAASVQRSFDLRPACLQRDLGLKEPQFQRLSAHGHVGRADLELAWERSKELQ